MASSVARSPRFLHLFFAGSRRGYAPPAPQTARSDALVVSSRAVQAGAFGLALSALRKGPAGTHAGQPLAKTAKPAPRRSLEAGPTSAATRRRTTRTPPPLSPESAPDSEPGEIDPARDVPRAAAPRASATPRKTPLATLPQAPAEAVQTRATSVSKDSLLQLLASRPERSTLGDKIRELLGEVVAHDSVKPPGSAELHDAMRALLSADATFTVASKGFRPLSFPREVGEAKTDHPSKLDVMRARLCAVLEDDSTLATAALSGVVAAVENIVQLTPRTENPAEVAAAALTALRDVGRLLSLQYRRTVVLARDVVVSEAAGHWDESLPLSRVRREAEQGEIRMDQTLAKDELQTRVKMQSQTHKAHSMSWSKPGAKSSSRPQDHSDQFFRSGPRRDRGRRTDSRSQGPGRRRTDTRRPPPQQPSAK